jgi:hypothetical protein
MKIIAVLVCMAILAIFPSSKRGMRTAEDPATRHELEWLRCLRSRKQPYENFRWNTCKMIFQITYKTLKI